MPLTRFLLTSIDVRVSASRRVFVAMFAHASLLAEAAPALKADEYRGTLGFRLVYVPNEAKVLVTASPAPRVLELVSEGGLEPPRPEGH
jgi:hypothetical protein